MIKKNFITILPPEALLENSFPEDLTHENGNYACNCVVCHCVFQGHKRRVVCKRCTEEENTGKG